MPTRKPETEFSFDSSNAASPSGYMSTSASQPPTRKRTPKRGIFVPLTESGTLDTDRVVEPEKIEIARAALGVVDPATLPPKEPVHINTEFILPAYSLLEVIIRFAGKKLLKWPEPLAAEMYFSEEKKHALVAPTEAVLSRFAPSWLIENQDIAALGAAFAAAVDDMVSKGVQRYVEKLTAAQQAQKRATMSAVPVQPVPNNGQAVAAA
jgi:hypothetical protein